MHTERGRLFADVGRIRPMRLGHRIATAVVLGLPTGPDTDRHAGCRPRIWARYAQVQAAYVLRRNNYIAGPISLADTRASRNRRVPPAGTRRRRF